MTSACLFTCNMTIKVIRLLIKNWKNDLRCDVIKLLGLFIYPLFTGEGTVPFLVNHLKGC